MAPRAVILGCAGPELGTEERRFFADADPLGFILFARNVETPAQLRRLVDALRDSVGRVDAPVLIDQEGGRVRRLRPPHWRAAPAAAAFGALAARDREAAAIAARLNARLIAAELAAAGIDVDCAPVCDVREAATHEAIGDRSFGSDPATVALLARATAEGLLDLGVLPVIKHIPGHGRARVDSHLALPEVDAPLDALRAVDFAPFRALADLPWAITAHVRYRAIDPDAPGTASPAVIRVVRDEIGFDGFLLSDDLSMQALAGSLAERLRGALAAGCDAGLHCTGDRAEMEEVVGATPRLSEAAQARFARGLARRRPAVDPGEALAWDRRLVSLLGEAA